MQSSPNPNFSSPKTTLMPTIPYSFQIVNSIKNLIGAGRIKPAIQSLILRRHLGDPVSPEDFAAVLRSIQSCQALIHGKQLHAHMIVTDFNHDTLVHNHLIGMYGKCGSLEDAQRVFGSMGGKNLHSWNTLIDCYCKSGSLSGARNLFDEMPQRDSVSWNTMISGYYRWGPCEIALQFFVGMRRSKCWVDYFSVSSVINACTDLRFLVNGKEIHGLSSKMGLDSHVQVGRALIGLYAKCGSIDDAEKAFDGMGVREQFTWNSILAAYVQCSKVDEALDFFIKMPEKNVVSWTTVIAGCSQHERDGEAIKLFQMMQGVGLRPDHVCFVAALNACVQMLNFREGLKVHGQIVKAGLEADAVVGSVLVALYAKSGCFHDVRSVIGAMCCIDDFSWSVLIAEYAKHGLIDSARELFESLEKKSLPLWNAIIGGYSEVGLDEEALEAFKQMQMGGTNGDDFTYASLLLGADVLGIWYGKQLHLQTIKLGVDSSPFVSCALIDMYSNNLECGAASNIFNSICEPNLVTWNAIISGYVLNNKDSEAVRTFWLMMVVGIKPDNITLSLILASCSSLQSPPRGRQVHAFAYKVGFKSDVVVGSALIDMYGKCDNMDAASQAFSDIQQQNVVSWTALLAGYARCGMLDEAKEIFNNMPEKNVISWNTMISGHSKHGSGLDALFIYSEMSKSGQLPDHVSLVSVLMVCGNLLLGELGKQVHTQIVKTGCYKNASVMIALSAMYQELGKIPVRSVPSLSSDLMKHENNPVMEEADAVSGNS